MRGRPREGIKIRPVLAKQNRCTKREPPKGWLSFGASSGIRTPDTLLKRQVLYLLS